MVFFVPVELFKSGGNPERSVATEAALVFFCRLQTTHSSKKNIMVFDIENYLAVVFASTPQIKKPAESRQ